MHSELDDEKNKLKEEKINIDKKVIKEVEIRLKNRKKQLEIDRNEVDKKKEELEIKEDKISTIVEKKVATKVKMREKKLKEGLDKLLVQNKSDYIFLDVPYGKALIFSTACLHGNVLNQTKTTRLSFNCRYKNLFTPYNKSIYSDKKLGSFYKPITPKAASMIGLNFKIDD